MLNLHRNLGVDIRKADGVTGKHMMSGWTGLDLLPPPPTTKPWPTEVPAEKMSFHSNCGAVSGLCPCSPIQCRWGWYHFTFLPASLL